MINYSCNEGEVKLDLQGDISELCADILTLIHVVHAKISSESLVEGLIFSKMIETNIEEVCMPMSGDEERIKKFTEEENEE